MIIRETVWNNNYKKWHDHNIFHKIIILVLCVASITTEKIKISATLCMTFLKVNVRARDTYVTNTLLLRVILLIIIFHFKQFISS